MQTNDIFISLLGDYNQKYEGGGGSFKIWLESQCSLCVFDFNSVCCGRYTIGDVSLSHSDKPDIITTSDQSACDQMAAMQTLLE